MIDLALLVAVFVAILALAYFTYRNVVGLDSRIRKIEDILQNAEVVSAPPQEQLSDGSVEPTEAPDSVPVPEEATESNTRIPGWGGEGPAITVEREQPEERDADDEYEEQEEDSVDDDSEEPTEERNVVVESTEERNIVVEDVPVESFDVSETTASATTESEPEREPERERPNPNSSTVSELKDALRRAGVSFPSSAKKAMLVSLVQENNVEV